MIEYVGKVRLDLSHWNGEDRYSDGDETENALMEAVTKEQDREKLGETAIASGKWPLLYHLSPIRENILNWYPFRAGSRILELGSGCGAMTGALLNRGYQVTAVDLSARRSRINAIRHQDAEDLTIVVQEMREALRTLSGAFDYVLLVGVLEYASVFIQEKDAHEVILREIRKLLKEDGIVLIAIENRLGLRYWAGAREDHTGLFFESLMNYPNHQGPRTFSRTELIRLCENCGYQAFFYYPYPDYKFPIQIFSDSHQPKPGEFTRSWQYLDADRCFLFDEQQVADSLIPAGLYREFADSFLVELTLQGVRDDRVVFVKSSCERSLPYRMNTLIIRQDGRKFVRKMASGRDSFGHIDRIAENGKRLREAMCRNARIEILPCRKVDEGMIEFPFMEGVTLRDVLTEAGAEGMGPQLLDFRKALEDSFGIEDFQVTEEFRRVFGDIPLPDGLSSLRISNLDMNFDNVFVENGRYTLFDYEWVIDFPIPMEYLLYRSLLSEYHFGKLSGEQQCKILKAAGIRTELCDLYLRMEQRFQKYVSGNLHCLNEFDRSAILQRSSTFRQLIQSREQVRQGAGGPAMAEAGTGKNLQDYVKGAVRKAGKVYRSIKSSFQG